MTAAFDYSELVTLATTLISQFGRNVSLQRASVTPVGSSGVISTSPPMASHLAGNSLASAQG